MKAVVDRIVQYPNRYQLTNVETGEVLGTFDFEEVTGTVQQVGTEIDKELFDSIANDLAARVKLSGGELAGTIVTFSDISGTAENVASGDTSATLWGKVKNWFSRLKALAFKNKVAAGDFEAGAIKNADVAADAAIAQSKVSGLMTDYVASISVSGRTVTYKNKSGVNMGSITTQDTTYGLASQSSNGLMSSTDKTKLDGIESGAQKNTVLGVKGGSESAYRTGNVNITKANIGLGNVDNTSDEDKPVSAATQTALKGKANTSGMYPNLTVGKATNADNATNATNATVHSVALVPSNADLNTYRGENYWGKRFYAGGSNTVQNTPIAGIAFSLEVLRSGAFATTQKISIMADVSNNRPTVFTRCVSDTTVAGGEGTWTAWTEVAEANGTYPDMTVGKAKSLDNGIRVSRGTSSDSIGWYKFATIPYLSSASNYTYSGIILVNGEYGPQQTAYAAESGIIEVDVRVTSGAIASTMSGISVLSGNLNPAEYCLVCESDNTASLYVYIQQQYGSINFTTVSESSESLDVHAEYEATYYGSAAPSGAVYAQVRNNASGDANGNSLMSHAARNELLNGTASYDFNDYVEWGHYELQGTSGTPLVNAPTSTSNPSATNADWYLDVYRRDSFYVTQIAYSARSDGAIAIRVLSNNSGGAWERLLKAGEAGTVVKSASEWSSQNPVLSAGQFGYDTTNKITKVGDGSTLWSALPFLVTTDLNFANASWKKIAILAENGDAQNIFSVGDEKNN